MKTPRMLVIAVATLTSFAFLPLAQAATPQAGKACPRLNTVSVYAGLRFTCAKVKGKLVWSKGVKVTSTNTASGPTNGTGNSNTGTSGGFTQPTWLMQNWDVLTGESLSPACTSSTPLTHAVAAVDQLESITPLGFVQHDSHNAPVPHMYFNTGSANGATDSTGRTYNSKKVSVFAPADITIRGVIQTMSSPYKEYSVGAHVCGKLWIAFNHLDDLAPQIQKAYDTSVGVQNPQINISVRAGEVIAMASGRAHGFDFRAMDASRANPGRINPAIWAPGWVTAVCGLEWYSGPLRDQMFAKLASKYSSNSCGNPFQDVAGTASGTWLQEQFLTNGNAGENGSFTLVKSHDTPGSFYLSIGANASVSGIKSATYIYQGSSTGLRNPDPMSIKPGSVACFDGLQTRRYEKAPAVVVRVTSGSREKIEVATTGSETCGAEPYSMPSTATVWWRNTP